MSRAHHRPPAPMSFFDKLEERARAVDSLLCVGLDPHPSDLEKAGCTAVEFCKRIIDVTSDVALAYKPNIAFFEALGVPGAGALEEVMRLIPEGIPIVLDNKRGDIGSTAEAYAKATFEMAGAHAMTASPYLGSDSLAPFLKDPARGVFVLCKTSNPSSSELQALPVAVAGSTAPESKEGGAAPRALFEEVAILASRLNTSNNVGLVVGATDVEGGSLGDALGAALRPDGMGLLLPVSRGISRAEDPGAAARELRDAINAARRRVTPPSPAATSVLTAAGGGAAGPAVQLRGYQKAFIELALGMGVLKFGSFTLKSGRQSPYFFNAGLFASGAVVVDLTRYYVSAILDAASQTPLDFDVLFGAAYKGIPLVTGVAMVFALGLVDPLRKCDYPVAYNRKEAKDHGEGGILVGADMKGKRVLVVDDVITGGTAVREAFGILRAAGATPAGVSIALDRQERTGAEGTLSDLSAIQQVEREYKVPVVSIIRLEHLLAYVTSRAGMETAVADIHSYRAKYGVES